MPYSWHVARHAARARGERFMRRMVRSALRRLCAQKFVRLPDCPIATQCPIVYLPSLYAGMFLYRLLIPALMARTTA